MDEILAKAGSQAVSFAIKSGISIASGYAIKTVLKFLEKIPEEEKSHIERTKKRLQTRIEIVSTAIDLIKLVAARGNTSLESTLRLTKDLKEEIDTFDETVTRISGDIDGKSSLSGRKTAVREVELYMKDLLERIEEAIPLISLALTTSGANLSATLPAQVSPGRLLQASTVVTKSNDQFEASLASVPVGPTFEFTYFSVFYNPGRAAYGSSEVSWKEDITKCQVQVTRNVAKNKEYAYTLELTEDFDDGRYHDEEETPKTIRLDLSCITRLFFSASGQLLKLGDRDTPVLVLKINRDLEATETSSFEWVAFGEVDIAYGDDDDEEAKPQETQDTEFKDKIRAASLSLFEYIVRLCALQANDQVSLLEVNDERLAVYLNDENASTSVRRPEEYIESRENTLRRSQKASTPPTSELLSAKLEKVKLSDLKR
ncbi:hypothetical protein BABINDRAFT_63470 [Babjeviella inositovora NRRL Y-12698]|uniref:Ran-specific GTPase-activating protein 30 n=1 Tax=Babjeviella inositovora NRRL Y-12698 TaxID=984486 RepID=A0A1E3QPQ2_9ASCO|nr:uncharacterized protein BABINDRAFT_63470 [Babjeviella inositovora NRRL Y-12698]ODQ78947.1 hypothetical protein BABINDRAFT_63470 [Babjeviella inositovora NRRL Y-12698]